MHTSFDPMISGALQCVSPWIVAFDNHCPLSAFVDLSTASIASRIAWRLVPPPDTITPTLNIKSRLSLLFNGSDYIWLVTSALMAAPWPYPSSASSTATTIPSPMLNVLYIICSSIWPFSSRSLKIGGIRMAALSGSLLGLRPLTYVGHSHRKPPPVIWLHAFTVTPDFLGSLKPFT